MELTFTGEVVFWKGPAPWYFVRVPDEESAQISAVSAGVTYGWGAIPVTAQLGRSTVQTSLFPKDGAYLVPLKARLRADEGIAIGDVVALRLRLAL